MSDIAPQPPTPAAVPQATDLRSLAIIVYGLYLGSMVTAGGAGLVGVILAYIKRDEAAGTIWYSHFENAIKAFWVWLGLFILGVATSWLLIGIPVIVAAFVYFLYRTVKGLLAAVDSRPYV
jgi:uncharacterized membrane protein